MPEIVALFLFVVLLCVAVLHLYWALGGLWPAGDEAALARMVVGVKNMEEMPGTALTIVVAALIATAGVLPLVFTGILPDPVSGLLPAVFQSYLPLVMLGALALVFLARGTLSYTSYFRKMEAVEPFVTLDRNYYAPLCLLLGAGFALLALGL
ncbi:MAG: DUF3995 domain-containing protein [Roseibium sp.]|nr:DUF3995 domain-containing protein [Roseibium sp.]